MGAIFVRIRRIRQIRRIRREPRRKPRRKIEGFLECATRLRDLGSGSLRLVVVFSLGLIAIISLKFHIAMFSLKFLYNFL